MSDQDSLTIQVELRGEARDQYGPTVYLKQNIRRDGVRYVKNRKWALHLSASEAEGYITLLEKVADEIPHTWPEVVAFHLVPYFGPIEEF